MLPDGGRAARGASSTTPTTLRVYTAHVSFADPDRLDVTRQTGGAAGEPFAPSWGLVRPVLAARRGSPPWRVRSAVAEAAWERFVPLYVEEMRGSYRARRDAWDRLLGRDRVVLTCYCVDPSRCHRGLLSGILERLGASALGNLAAQDGDR